MLRGPSDYKALNLTAVAPYLFEFNIGKHQIEILWSSIQVAKDLL